MQTFLSLMVVGLSWLQGADAILKSSSTLHENVDFRFYGQDNIAKFEHKNISIL